MRGNGQSKDASTRDAVEIDGGLNSSRRASSWLPESGYGKALLLQRLEGERLRCGIQYRTAPGAKGNGDRWGFETERDQGSVAYLLSVIG